MKTKITLVTPSYNQGKYLEKTINSILSQRDQLHEYFIVDGKSTDKSLDIIKKYDSQIDWWTSETDKGQSDAIHKGFIKATGDVLGWVNSDDLLTPGSLELIRYVFDSNPKTEIVSGYLVHIDSEDRIILMPRVPSGKYWLAQRGLVQVSQQCTFFRRSLYERIGGLDLSLHCAMDLDLWARFYDSKAVWRHIPVYLGAFRRHNEAKGSGNEWWDKYQNEKKKVRSRYPNLFGDPKKILLASQLYRLTQLLSGRLAKSAFDTYRCRGKQINEIFKLSI